MTRQGESQNTGLLRATFPGNSEMARRLRAFDWAGSDFGPVEKWPEHLRIAVRLCITSRFPIALWWGPKLRLLYNDAYLPWLTKTRHPRVLGRPGDECWNEISDVIQPLMQRVLTTGQGTLLVDKELFVDRKVRKEEVYITSSYSPVLAADGKTVDGIFNPCFETTEKVIGARRLKTLLKFGICAGKGRSVEAACKEAAAVLSENRHDIPFAAIYVANEAGDEATLCATTLPAGEHRLPLSVSASDDHPSTWPLASVLRTKCWAECARLEALGVRLCGGPWPDATRLAFVVPIPAAQDKLAGLLIVGVSPRRPFDEAYRTFFDLVAAQIASAISNARAYEAERQRADVLTSPTKGILEAYDRWCCALGDERNELLQKTWPGMTHSDDPAPDVAQLNRVMARRTSPSRNGLFRHHARRLAQLRALHQSLTPRERQVMSYVVMGMLNKQIGTRLNIAEKTVKFHRAHVMDKMQAGSLAELVLMASELGIV